MTRKLTDEELERLGLTDQLIEELGLTDEWVDEELARMMTPSRMSETDRAAWLREETAKRRREGAGIAGGWQWIDRSNPPRVMPIEKAIEWASDRACSLDEASEERSALVALLEGVGAGATFLKRLTETQETGGAYLRREIGRPELRAAVFEPDGRRENEGEKGQGRLDAYLAGKTVEQFQSEGSVTREAVKKSIQAEAAARGLGRIVFPGKPRNRIRRN